MPFSPLSAERRRRRPLIKFAFPQRREIFSWHVETPATALNYFDAKRGAASKKRKLSVK